MHYIEINISDKQRQEAFSLYPFSNLNNSIMEGRSNIYGALGEVVIRDCFGGRIVGDFDYDLIIDSLRVDVKTKKTTVRPRPEYNCSVVHLNQDCDYYLFVRILSDLTKAYLLGYLSRDEMRQKATFNRKGEIETHIFNFRADCYNVRVDKLNEFNHKKICRDSVDYYLRRLNPTHTHDNFFQERLRR